jgi:hypothetical protein
MLDQSGTRLATPLEARDERSMKLVEYAMALTAVVAAVILAFIR